MNYRSLTNAELARVAEQRLIELADHGIPGGDLWPEVLYRLQRNSNQLTEVPSRGAREGILTVPLPC